MSNIEHTISIDLGDRSYPIYIGDSLLTDSALFSENLPYQHILVVSNDTIAPLYLQSLQTALGNRLVESVVLPDGEQHKTLNVLNNVFDALMSGRFGRDCCVLALGGGVVGDMAGFAAASYQRGVAFIQVPTSLLAQVDSSVGGKTGVNHVMGKNMIGAFHQPEAVVIDTDVLSTLPDRELSAGLAEVIKYGFIQDADFLNWLQQNMPALLARDTKALVHAIKRSCEIKAEIVAADEREHGVRAYLNFGHTFGHAIETAQGYGNWLHGEAVAAGMSMALKMSKNSGWLTQQDVERGLDIISAANLPISPPANMTSESFLELMARDKKVRQARINLILLHAIGDAVVSSDYDDSCLTTTINECLKA